MSRIVIDSKLCKGCKKCVDNCPKNCIRIGSNHNDHAYYYAEQHEPENCIACKICAYSCPEACITVYKNK